MKIKTSYIVGNSYAIPTHRDILLVPTVRILRNHYTVDTSSPYIDRLDLTGSMLTTNRATIPPKTEDESNLALELVNVIFTILVRDSSICLCNPSALSRHRHVVGNLYLAI